MRSSRSRSAGCARGGGSRRLQIWSLTILLTILAAALRGEEAADRDDRSREILDYSCSSAGGEHSLTLFANGTLRLKERSAAMAEPLMALVELTETELAAYVNRLRMKVYDRVHRSEEGGPSGEWVEQCRLEIATGTAEPIEYRFSPIENSSLDLAHALSIANELLEEARTRSRSAGFPVDYVPRRGDILLRQDGTRFKIERFTSDGRGVEISGLEQPLVLYVEVSQVANEFAGLLERKRR